MAATAAVAGVCGLIVLGAWLHHWGSQDRIKGGSGHRFAAIIIFGARVNSRGEPSVILRGRTEHAFELWRRGVAPAIVCTGGVGTYPPAEAQVEQKLLSDWGVPRSALLVDDSSTSTRENAFNAAVLLGGHGDVVAVSEPFHLWRCRRDCRLAGLNAFASPEWEGWRVLSPPGKLYYLVREAILVTRDSVLGLLHQ